MAGGDDCLVAGADRGELCGVEAGSPGGFGGEDLLLGAGEEHDHLERPLLAFGFAGGVELTQVMGVT